jgi:hypothetical protein
MLQSRKTVAGFSLLGLATLFFVTVAVFMRLNAATLRNEIGLVAVGLFWIAYAPTAILLRSRQSLKNPALQGLSRYQFDANGYTRESPQGRTEIKWSDLVRWREGKASLLLYPQPKAAIVIPKRFFENSADVDSVKGFLRKKVAAKA